MAERVEFIGTTGQASKVSQTYSHPQAFVSAFTTVQTGEKRVVKGIDFLMFSFEVGSDDRVVTVISEADTLFLEKVSEDWLLDTLTVTERDFLLLKQGWVDPQTGLLNISHLIHLLDTIPEEDRLHIVLIELPPQRSSYYHALRHKKKCTSDLRNLLRHGSSSLHYLGHSTFAMVFTKADAVQSTDIEKGLVPFLRNRGLRRVHVGTSSMVITSEDQYPSARRVLDEAWTALRHASRKGPYSYSDYAHLAHPENHLLAPPPPGLTRRIAGVTRSLGMFSLVLVHSDDKSCAARTFLTEHIGDPRVFFYGDDILVLLDTKGPEEAVDFVSELQQRLRQVDGLPTVSAGIACYPCADFKKSAMLQNCRKALLHAAYFGPSSAAVFDAVSLNVSGDIYFSDGDLAKAVGEYRKGLQCDSSSVNLHNSLGVTLAMMNKPAAAMRSFEEALGLEKNNFMALYNLGLAEAARNNKDKALDLLEKAYDNFDHEEGESATLNDLRLQMGELAADTGRNNDALIYLSAWRDELGDATQLGRSCYHLGKALLWLEKRREAMVELQRALHYNEYDDRAMHLLSLAYFLEGEGDEVALSLCRKSVELEPLNDDYRLLLAEILIQCGDTEEAKEHLYRCLRKKHCRPEAQLLFCRLYRQKGDLKRAETWLEKLVGQKGMRPELKAKAAQERTQLRNRRPQTR